MKPLISYTIVLLLSTAFAQYENGFVKILEDQRYQDGSSFGNFRNQEDGIKYKEESDANGVRRGFWEYPDESGQINRVEFEAGAGIGFRIISSNIVAPTPVAHPQPQPTVPRESVQAPRAPVQAPRAPVQAPRAPVHVPLVKQPVHQVIQPVPTTPGPQHLFDYPADLQFFRDAGGHRFKFTAT